MLFDPAAQYRIGVDGFYSKSCNTPFAGRPVRGRVVSTYVGGERKYQWGEGTSQ
ncbi:MAG: hypothetical protein N3A57_02185 [Negativicutes bacterium]|nr:hypothetical protein [Negativicutes bacterium]